MKWFLILFVVLCSCNDSKKTENKESTGACYAVLESVCLGGKYASCRIDIKKIIKGVQLPLAKNFEVMRITVPFLTVKDDIVCRKTYMIYYSNGSILYERKYWDFKDAEQKLETK